MKPRVSTMLSSMVFVGAHPASLTARVLEARGDAERAADDGDALVDHDRLVVTEVEDADRPGRAVDGDEHRRHAVVNVQVTLSLAPVAQDLEARGVALQLSPE